MGPRRRPVGFDPWPHHSGGAAGDESKHLTLFVFGALPMLVAAGAVFAIGATDPNDQAAQAQV